MKKLLVSILCLVIVSVGIVWGKCCLSKQISGSGLFTENIEALSDGGDAVIVMHCEGNTGTCAKGVDSTTGHNFIIHGRATNGN